MIRFVMIVALALAACGETLPQAVRRGSYLEAYGFRCECGSNHFEILSRTFEVFKVRCPKCHHEWVIKNGEHK